MIVKHVIEPGKNNHEPGYRALVEELAVGQNVVFIGLASSGVCSRLNRHAKRVKFKLRTRAIIYKGQQAVCVERVA